MPAVCLSIHAREPVVCVLQVVNQCSVGYYQHCVTTSEVATTVIKEQKKR
jgi:hypothetical protein